MVLTDIIERRYENLTSEETEAIREDLAARMNILTLARREAERGMAEAGAGWEGPLSSPDGEDDLPGAPNTLLTMVRKFINVRELDIDLIDSVNTFRERFEIASKSFNSSLLSHMQSAMVAIRVQMTEEEVRTLWPESSDFGRRRAVNPTSSSRIRLRSGWPRLMLG